MPITFYPSEHDLEASSLPDKVDTLMDAAQRYKAIILETSSVSPKPPAEANAPKKRIAPRDLSSAFNWEEVAKLLREIRELPEGTPAAKGIKAGHLVKLAEIYEVLRAAKMPKLEAVRLALMNEANQLRGNI